MLWGQNVIGQNVADKMPWTKCGGQNVGVKMSWIDNVVDKMLWTKCRGQNVVNKMSWSICSGKKCSGQDAPGILSCIK